MLMDGQLHECPINRIFCIRPLVNIERNLPFKNAISCQGGYIMHIDFHDQTKSVPSDYVDLLQRLLVFTAKKEEIANEAEVSVTFVSNQEIKEINRNYRQQDRPTDVISFAMQEKVTDEVEIIGE